MDKNRGSAWLGSTSGRARARMRSVAPRRRDLKSDSLAGLPGAISSVPDGMAASVLAGVNPIHGLYASFAGPIGGGLTSSTRLMVITTTSAAALAAGSAIHGLPSDEREGALVLLTLIAGAVMIAAALLRVGRYIRFVSQSVMLGFLTGIAVNIVFGQIPDLTGVEAEGNFSLTKALDVLLHPSEIDPASLLAGGAALAILVLLGRTRLGLFSSLIALAIPTVVILLVGNDTVARVRDVGDIPAGIPLPQLPDLSTLSPTLLTGALSVAAIVLVQGAGVAEAAPNPDGSRSSTNQDFTAQGVANVASGFFGGQPVGGSVGQTALNVSAGAVSRWAAIFSGIWMLVILVAFSKLVAEVAMPTLAAVLIYAAVGSLKPAEVLTILRTGATPLIAFAVTFVATLLLPVAVAVGIGVTVSLLLQLNQESVDLRVVRLRLEDGHFIEEDVPQTLSDGDVVILDVYGSLFYAGARTLQRRLPDPAASDGAVVILRLRGRTTLGATFFTVIAGYARQLATRNGRLYLSGVDAEVTARWTQGGYAERAGKVRLYEASPQIGESTTQAFHDAQTHAVVPVEDAPA
jgi:SulP family sulfate permease